MCNVESILAPAAAVVGSAFLGPEIGAGIEGLTGITSGAETIGGALAGSGLGAASSAITGGNPLTGALEGGVGGAIGPNIGDIFNGITGSGTTGTTAAGGAASTAPAGTAPATGGTAGGGFAGAAPGAAATAAPAGISGGGGDVSFDSSSLSSPSTGGVNIGTPSVDNLQSGSITSPAGSTGIGGSGAGGGSVGSSTPIPGGASNLQAAAGSGTSGNSITNAFNNPTGSNILSALGKNSNVLVPGLGLAYNAIEGNQAPKGLSNLESTAGQLANQGGTLQQYLQTGTLPPGVQGSLDQAAQSAKAAIKSKYAAMGASGSSAEAQELANVDTTTASQGANLALNLLNQGVTETQLSSELYQQIMQTTLQQDQNLQNAVSNFASAAAGGGGTNLHITTGA